MLTVGSLFAGIGGFDLGFERAGMRTLWFCEQNDYCRRVLARHWSGVPCHPDVRALVAESSDGLRRSDLGGVEGLQATGEATPRNGPVREGNRSAGPHGPTAGNRTGDDRGPLPVPVPYVDVLCGGFPCQDLSYAGKGAGIDGERSGLWGEYARLIRELRPRYVVVENVPALLGRGLGRVLGDLAACGMDCEWGCIRAADVGAPHLRDRVWIVAYAQGSGCEARDGDGLGTGTGTGTGCAARTASANDPNSASMQRTSLIRREPDRDRECRRDVADADVIRCDWRPRVFGPGWWRQLENRGWWLAESGVCRVVDGLPSGLDGGRLDAGAQDGSVSPMRVVRDNGAPARSPSGRRHHEQRSSEPGDVVRAVPQPPPLCGRVPHRVDRVASLGNALMPQIAEWIGRRIVEYEEGRLAA